MMISATVLNAGDQHRAVVRTDGRERTLVIPARVEGPGSGVNGGELLFLALATCYCNDLYREAAERGIRVSSIEVEVSGSFGSKGQPAEGVRYRASVEADGSREEILELMRHTDTVAEIHHTVRRGTPVILGECTVLAPRAKNAAGNA